MSGKNQHHIPRFVQRGFAVEGTNQHKIWRFDTERLPKRPSSIRSTGAEENFYSEESEDGSPTLDDQITEEETPLAVHLNDLRSLPTGTLVSGKRAAELIDHLAPRTAHLRQTIERGTRQLVSGAAELFASQGKLEAMLGIDQQEPNEIFREKLGDTLRGNPAIAASGLPDSVLERMAFYLAKEQFGVAAGDMLPMLRQLFDTWISTAGETVRAGHNKALSKRDGPNLRRDFLEGLTWRIADGPSEGNILPDCVALGIQSDGNAAPLMLGDIDEMHAVVMPLSSRALLVGFRTDEVLPLGFNFNREAARSSHRFFLAATNVPEITTLQPLIDERTSHLIDETVADAMKDAVPPERSMPAHADEPEDEAISGGEDIATEETPWTFELSTIGFADDLTARKIGEAVNQLVGALGRSLPLRRLNGITFADDYPAALQALDRGMPGAEPATTVDASIGLGIAQTVNIMRDGVIMCRIVMRSCIALALIGDDDEQVDWAIAVIVRQLALVANYAILDATLPGVLLTRIEKPLEGALYGSVGAAIDAYSASHICAGFGDPNVMADAYRELLSEALHRMRDTVLPARLAYRYHGDLDALLAVTMPAIRYVLLFAADVLGHCAALGTDAVEPGSALALALEEAGLGAWFARYATDLESLRLRSGRWESFDEFLAFTVHVERLMWQLGMIPWEEGGNLRVAVPVGTDAEALLANEPAGQPRRPMGCLMRLAAIIGNR